MSVLYRYMSMYYICELLPCRTKWAKIHGILYKSLCAAVVGLQDNVKPQFGQIEDILVINNEVYFNVKLLETSHFSEHYQCYVVTYTTEHTTIHHSHLVFHITPLHIRNINGLTDSTRKAILLKHHVSTP